MDDLSEAVIIHFSLLNQHQGITESPTKSAEEEQKTGSKKQNETFQKGLLCMVSGTPLSP